MTKKKINTTGLPDVRARDLTGFVSHDLTVISFSHRTNRTYWWNCLCICGNMTKVSIGELTRTRDHRIKSCGCYNKRKREKFREEYPYRHVYSTYKGSAKYSGKIFELEYEDFKKLILQNCVYCGATPYNKFTYREKDYYYNGVDRIDSNKGYTWDNVVACCRPCNTAKMSYDAFEFLDRCERIANRWFQREPMLYDDPMTILRDSPTFSKMAKDKYGHLVKQVPCV